MDIKTAHAILNPVTGRSALRRLHFTEREDAFGGAIKVAFNELCNHQWRNAQHRPPEKEGKYLCYFTLKNNGRKKHSYMYIDTVCYLLEDGKARWVREGTEVIVTHWMPLPQPPEDI